MKADMYKIETSIDMMSYVFGRNGHV